MDKDLSDHGALAYNKGLEGVARDLPDTDLSDHGALAYNKGLEGVARDLPDTDLSDHGAIAYASKQDVWGTNDEELVDQINILMHASYSDNIDQIIPLLNADSLAKIVNYRFRQVANIFDTSRYGINNDKKEALGTQINMDLAIINSMISSNPNCTENIFTPSLYIGSENFTDIFGVLKKYQEMVDKARVTIPLINGANGEQIKNELGQVVTAQDALQYLMSKKEMNLQEKSSKTH